MSQRKRIMPAVTSLDRSAAAALHEAPLDECLAGGPDGIARVADALGPLSLEMKLSRLTQEEQGPVRGDGHEEVAQALEPPLSRCPDVQEAADASPEESRRTRLLLDEMDRAVSAAQLFESGARDGRRLVAGLLSHGCLALVQQIEQSVRQGVLQGGQKELLSETAGLRARARAYNDRLEAQRDKDTKALAGLAVEAAEAEAGVEADRAVAAVRRGGDPGDEAALRAAARLEGKGGKGPGGPERRGKGR